MFDILIIYQDSRDGSSYFPQGSIRYVNPDDGNLYSILDTLEKYRRPGDGYFHLKLCYPLLNAAECAVFRQSNHPGFGSVRSGFSLVSSPVELDGFVGELNFILHF